MSPSSPALTLELTIAESVSLVTECAGSPVLQELTITNGGVEPVSGAELGVRLVPRSAGEAPFGEQRSALPLLPAGERVSIAAAELCSESRWLRAVEARQPAELVVEVIRQGEVLARESRPLEILAFDEWPGLGAPAGLLACFVTPNDPALVWVARAVSEELAGSTREGSVFAYRAGSPARARAEVTALYTCLQRLELQFAREVLRLDEPQRMRLVERVLRERAANALDLALLLASALEALEFAPLLILLDGKVFLGVWLEDERFPEGVVEDAARLRTLHQLDSLLIFDPAVLADGPMTEAERRAAQGLESDERFRAALDVRALRRAGFLPLPIREEAPRAAAAAGTEGVHRTVPMTEAGERTRVPATTSPGAEIDTQTDLRFRKWQESLLDLTLRNRLLNFRITRKTTLSLDVPDVERFEELLAANRALQILPRPARNGAAASKTSEGNETEKEAEAAEVREAIARDLEKAIVYAKELDAELWDRALELDRAARRDLEEGGAATLFAAIGLLSWYESAASEEPRLSPLLLYPVKIEFDRRTRRLVLRREAEDPIANQTLIEKMRLEYGVDLSSLAALEPGEPGTLAGAVLRSARDAIQRLPRWEVLPQVHLGLFTFRKFLMWRDLSENAERLLQSPAVRRIAHSHASAGGSVGRVDPARLDWEIAPADLPCVLDLDGTQLGAVATALRGESFVLQGPPGTGKSQTITSLIAAALAGGKTVLFVSEKMAALEVVHRRLGEVGLSDFCLELHSHKASKKDVLDSFDGALSAARAPRADDWQERCAALAAARNELNTYVHALHAPTPLGVTYHGAITRLRELGERPDIALSSVGIAHATNAELQTLARHVAEFAAIAARVAPVAEHPWRACQRAALGASDEQGLFELLGRAAAALEQLERVFQPFALRLGYAGNGSWDEIDVVLQSGEALCAGVLALDREWQSGPVARAVHEPASWPGIAAHARAYVAKRRELDARVQDLRTRWHEAFFQQDLSKERAEFARASGSILGWFSLRGPKRTLAPLARGALPNTPQIARDLATLAELPPRHQELLGLEAALALNLKDVWAAIQTSPERVLEALARSERFRDAWAGFGRLPGAAALQLGDASQWRTVAAELEQHTGSLRSARADWQAFEHRVRSELQLVPEFWPQPSAPGARAALLGWLRHWAAQLPRLRSWCHYVEARRTLDAHGLSGVVAAHAAGLDAARLPECFEVAFLRRWQIAWLDATPLLREFVGASHHARVERFAALDAEHRTASRARVVALLERVVPRRDSALKGSELELLLRECQKKTRHLPVRKLLAKIPELRTKLKPCFLMSPLSVAQYLPPEASFDLVVFDEASQIETHDAIGAIGRGRQVVIVGDSRQLPPTRFFSRRASEDAPANETDVEDLESILDEARAKGFPELTLDWHYRSRHDSLIEFSNQQYYASRLQIFPAARRYVEDLGVSFHPIPRGTYQPGEGPNGRINPTEARAIVEQLVGALKRHAPGERSFGVVTFSLSQRKLIEDLLEQAREDDPSIEPHFEGPESVFVKNLESVQGDERDEILFSICYGPETADHSRPMRHNFGPLNLKGGERRLNVAITRARKQLRVFSSMTHADIDLRKTSAQGARDLRRFLEFAASRSAAHERHEGKPKVFDSVIEREIHDELVQLGYSVHTKVGTGRYQLDLAVVHREDRRVYALAIESDGPTYRDAPVARDRDRLRGAVLRDMLWKTHRIWSSDWLRNKEAEVQRLVTALRAVQVPVGRAAPAKDAAPSRSENETRA